MDDHINLQQPKASKIFGVIKTGANKTDQNLIKALQQQGYNEHEIQHKSGVHYTVVRTFMKFNDPSFVETEAPITPETQHLHDKIAALEAQISAAEEEAETPEEAEPEEEY